MESNSLTSDRTQAPCTGTEASLSLNHQGSPSIGFLMTPFFFFSSVCFLRILYLVQSIPYLQQGLVIYEVNKHKVNGFESHICFYCYENFQRE